MKAIDIVKPAPKNRLEAWMHWMNWTETRLRTLPLTQRIKIEVK